MRTGSLATVLLFVATTSQAAPITINAADYVHNEVLPTEYEGFTAESFRYYGERVVEFEPLTAWKNSLDGVEYHSLSNAETPTIAHMEDMHPYFEWQEEGWFLPANARTNGVRLTFFEIPESVTVSLIGNQLSFGGATTDASDKWFPGFETTDKQWTQVNADLRRLDLSWGIDPQTNAMWFAGGENGVYLESITVTYANVPEPGTLALLGLGLAGVGAARRRKVLQ